MGGSKGAINIGVRQGTPSFLGASGRVSAWTHRPSQGGDSPVGAISRKLGRGQHPMDQLLVPLL